MRVLIAYDGTPGADAALEDLAQAGLPPDAEAMVLTVADASMALASRALAMAATGMTIAPRDHRMEEAAAALEHARSVAAEAAARIRVRFPGWRVEPDAWGGSPGSSIVLKADAWKPDLVVLGSRGLARPARMLLGGVARKVLTESRCSVRVARAPAGAPGRPLRVLVGHDGAGAGQAALLAACARAWPEGSEVRAVAVHESFAGVALGPEFASATWPVSGMPVDRSVLRKLLDDDVARAQRGGLTVFADIARGVPSGVLLRIARSWPADCVFLGATNRSRAARFLLGSVAATVADRARCSVEIVRPRAPGAPHPR